MTVSTHNTELAILNTAIRRDAEGRYCLNDCHRAAGGEKKDEPSRWSRLDTTQALIAELRASPETGTPLSTVNDGRNNGTYVAKELVYAYAMWISPAFHLLVIRAFDAMATGAIHIPKTMAEALRLAADQAEQIERQSQQIAAAQPKVEGFDRLANSDGMFQLRVAAKLLDWPERKFIERLHAMEWIYKLKTGGNWIAHADKLRSAVLVHKSYTHTDEAGDERTRHQVFVTPKGLARLSLLLGEYAPSGSRGPDTPGPGGLPPMPPPVQPALGLGHGATP